MVGKRNDTGELQDSVFQFNHLKTKRVCFIQGLSAYRAVKILLLVYKKQSFNVVQGKSRCLFRDLSKHITAM
jgi:hypothetical protein